MKILEIIGIVGTIFSALYIGYILYDGAKQEAFVYEKVGINIQNDIKPNMTAAEIKNIVEVNCQSWSKSESDTYLCVTSFMNKIYTANNTLN